MQSTDLRSLNDKTHHALPTSEAARRLSLKTQILRAWAHYETGPITPIAVNAGFCWLFDTLLLAMNGDTDSSEGGAR